MPLTGRRGTPRARPRPGSPRPELAAYRSYRASGSYVSADGRTISFATSLAAGNATTTAAAAGNARRPGRRRPRGPGGRRRGLRGHRAGRVHLRRRPAVRRRPVDGHPDRHRGHRGAARAGDALADRAAVPDRLRGALLLRRPRPDRAGVRQRRGPARADVHPAVPAVRVPAGAGRGLQHPGHDADQGRSPAAPAARGRGPGANRHRYDGDLGRAGAGRDVRGAGHRGVRQRRGAERPDDRERRRGPRAWRADGHVPGQDAAGAVGGGADRAVELVAVRAVPGAAGRRPSRPSRPGRPGRPGARPPDGEPGASFTSVELLLKLRTEGR